MGIGGYILYKKGILDSLLDKLKLPIPPSTSTPLPPTTVPVPTTPSVPSTSPTPTTPTPLPPVSSGTVDQFGIRKIYPDGPGGTLTNFVPWKGTRNYSSGAPSTNSNEWNITNLPADFLDQEVTGYFLIQATSNDDLAFKLRGGRHSDSNASEGSCYDFGLAFNGGCRLRKEKPHPSYHPCSASCKQNIGSIKGKWIGMKAITYNEGNGVRCQMWADPGGLDSAGKPANRWVNNLDLLDNGSNCYQAPFLKRNGAYIQIRVDDTKSIQAKYLSGRGIKAASALAAQATILNYGYNYFQRRRPFG